jgi:hypothetical protein
MKSSIVAALGAAVLTFGLSSAAQAALIDFSAAVLGGTTSTAGVFVDAPIFLIFSANQARGPGHAISATFTDTTDIGAIPETSTWAMMALGFGALGYAASRRRKASIAMLSA